MGLNKTAQKQVQQELVFSTALANQMKADRKSMNKSVAFVSGCHDIRTALVAISSLINLCRATAKPEPELTSNLHQMSSCAMDLLVILNSIIDTSKIEARKMQLEEEEFNVAKLVEDVVDLFYPLSMKKGVDIVLDPTDCSIFEHIVVKRDRAKLKQILCNLLRNAKETAIAQGTGLGLGIIRSLVHLMGVECKCSLNLRNILCFGTRRS
ncbi:histidine kinase CKI1-like [Salvia splendens]|uniref:histidine kinase CKI1-like n=1 Tax=Salvia splendens TaxID=180675 RepID=UPI001C273663|nr:histidine kinase CKI1-like [Salvia splendens]